MREHTHWLGARGLLAAVVVVGAGAADGLTRLDAVRATTSVAAGAACAAVGVYLVGPRVLPMAPAPNRSGAPLAQAPGSTATMLTTYYLGALRGSLRIRAYSGCGAPTAGSFAVTRVALGPPIERNATRGAVRPGIACRLPCYAPVGVQSATGSFAQDPRHPGDPLYVAVSATITSTRLGPQMGRPCSTRDGCPPPNVITSTATLSDVTGYLQVNADAGQGAATLIFPATAQPQRHNGPAPDPAGVAGRWGHRSVASAQSLTPRGLHPRHAFAMRMLRVLQCPGMDASRLDTAQARAAGPHTQ